MVCKLILPFLLLLTSSLHCAQAIRYVVTAPNTFRYGVLETVGISISDTASPVDVEVYLQDYPLRSKTFSSKTLRILNGQPQVTTVAIQPSDIPEKERDKSDVRVYVVVNPTRNQFPKREVLVPVTKHSGYAFIQTDKPLYLPNQKVEIRVLSLNEKLLPNRDIFTLEVKNPDDVRVMFEGMKPEANGMASSEFKLSTEPKFGNWKIIVHYGYKQSASSVINFEVKEYVLPRFSVAINTPRTIVSSSKTIEGTVSARYVYGEPVQGTVILKFAIKTTAGLTLSIGLFKNNQLDRNGEHKFKLDVEKDIRKNNIPWFPGIAGARFVVEADVMEQSSGKRERNIDTSSMFTNSPYRIVFPRSRNDFKPGVPYQVQVDVRYADGTELDGRIQVRIEEAFATTQTSNKRPLMKEPMIHTTDDLGRVMFEFTTGNKDTQLQITVKTAAENVLSANQAVGKLTVVPFTSPDGKSYVWIAAPQMEFLTFQVGGAFKTHVTINPPDTQTNLYYMVISRGAILHFSEVAHEGDAFVRSVQFPITAAMSPSARLIVFIIKGGNIIADSMRLIVERVCSYNNMQGLHLTRPGGGIGAIRPEEATEIEIRGEPNSYVGIAGVDEALYVLNKRQVLTPEKMFSEIDSHDLGCGPGGGENTEAVFRQAGVTILSSANIRDHSRKSDCKPKHRAKRAAENLEDKVREYTGENKYCCSLGLKEGQENTTCTERANTISNSTGKADCAKAFLECCEHTLQFEVKISALIARMNAKQGNDLEDYDEDIELDEVEVLRSIRELFPETLFFKTFGIGGTECTAVNKAGNICSYKFNVPHSITRWKIQAVGISNTTGMCVAEPMQLTVFKSLFLQMDLPYSAVRGEQIEVPVTVFNYGGNDLNVKVYMLGVEGICMGLSDGERSEIHRIAVPAKGAKTVTFPVMPLQVTEYSLRAVVMSSDGSDAISKTLKVVPEGVKKVVALSRLLDPAGVYRQRNKRAIDENEVTETFGNYKHTITLDMDLPNNHVPGSENCFVSVVGSVMGQAVATTLSNAVQGFIRLPSGCCEQTLSGFAPLVYAMLYLKRSKQMTPDVEKNGYQHMQNGYIHQLKYRNADGSFGYFSASTGTNSYNLGLTAFVARVFCQMNDFIRVSNDVSCRSVAWLVRQQKPSGAFDGHRFANLMTPQENNPVSTAFVLIALNECHQCNTREKNTAISKAVTFLESQVAVVQRPFALAIMAYALTLSNSIRANDAITRLKNMALYDEDTNTRWWQLGVSNPGERGRPWIYKPAATSEAVITTSYVLLTLLHNEDIEYSHAIAKWINQQRSPLGSFTSTQDTVVALQALAEYSTKAVVSSPDMVCNITSQRSGRGRRTIVVNKHNALLLQEGKVQPGGKLVVITEGRGVASMNIAMQYNVDERPEDNCKFELNVNSSEYTGRIRQNAPNVLPNNVLEKVLAPKEYGKLGNNEQSGPAYDTVQLNICMRFLEAKSAEMSILEVGILTGYKMVEDDLKSLIDDKQRTKLSHYELTDRAAILYLDEVSNNKPMCLQLRTTREIKVGQVQPTAVKVYDYYEPSKVCTKFYRPSKGSPMLQKICEGRQCTCIEGQCPVDKPFESFIAKTADTRLNDLIEVACEKHHYVWLVQHRRTYNERNLKYYEVTVMEVWKEGLQSRDALENEVITFSSRQECSYPIMKAGEQYVIMGTNTIQTRNEDRETIFKYVFTKETSVYHSQDIKKFVTRGEQSMQKSFNALGKRLVNRGCPN